MYIAGYETKPECRAGNYLRHIITTAISHHSDKNALHGPYDELLKDADVMDHCFYNADFPVDEREADRYGKLLMEFGIGL